MSEVQKLDVKNTKEAIVGAFKFAKAIKEAKANNGKYDLLDLPLLIGVAPYIGPMVEDANLIPAELKDADSAETAELLALVAAEVGGVTDNVKLLAQINAGLDMIRSIAAFVRTF